MDLSVRVSSWRKVPILLAGYDIRRWEGPGAYQLYDPEYYKKLVFWRRKPEFGPTHIQYESPVGFLITWPLCFHIWLQLKQREPGVPGSETVFYFRVGARWDALDAVYVCPSLYPGLHWD